MNKLNKILSATLFFCTIPVVNLFALSKEATELIEIYRQRAIRNESISQSVSTDYKSGSYVAGRELAMALSKVKRIRYSKIIRQNNDSNGIMNVEPLSASDQDNSKLNEDLVINNTSDTNIQITKPNEDVQNNLNNSLDSKNTTSDTNTSEYHVGEMLAKSLNRVRSINNKSTNRKDNDIKNEIINDNKKSDIDLDTQDQNTLETIQKANEEIEEIFENPMKREKLAESGRNRYNTKNEIKNDDNEKIDDEEFNNYIKKYNFKMPENYRLLVD